MFRTLTLLDTEAGCVLKAKYLLRPLKHQCKIRACSEAISRFLLKASISAQTQLSIYGGRFCAFPAHRPHKFSHVNGVWPETPPLGGSTEI
jgi:glycerol dehydrogenase-like iron-containing ADH family enzyme